MNELNDRGIRGSLKKAFPPIDSKLPRDLWPDMLRQINASRATPPLRHLPWYDWALIGGSASALAFFPKLILLFAFHL